MSDLVDALLAPVHPTVDLNRALNGRDGWERTEPEPGPAVRAASKEALVDDDAGRATAEAAAPRHAVHGVALLPSVNDQAALLHETAGPLLTDVLRRGLRAVALQLYRDRIVKLLKALVRESMEAVLVAFTNRTIEGTVHQPSTAHTNPRLRALNQPRPLHRAPLQHSTEGAEPPPAPEPGTTLAQQLRDLTTERYNEALLHVFDMMLVVIERTVTTHAFVTDALADYSALRLRLLALPTSPEVPAVGVASASPPPVAALSGLLAAEQEEIAAMDAALVAWARSAAPVDQQLQQESEEVIHAVCEMAHIRAARLMTIRKEVWADTSNRGGVRGTGKEGGACEQRGGER